MIVSAKPTLKPVPLGNDPAVQQNHFQFAQFYRNGRSALVAALKNNGLTAGDNIVVPALFCSSGLEAVLENGFKCVFMDITDSYTLHSSQLKKTIEEENIKAIILVHYFGLCSKNRSKIIQVAKKKNVTLVEDFCHSFLSYWKEASSFKRADACIFSFRKIIPVSTGGAVIFSAGNASCAMKSLDNRHTRISMKISVINHLERILVWVGWPNPNGKTVFLLKKLIKKIIKNLNLIMKKSQQSNQETLLTDDYYQLLGDSSYLMQLSLKRRENYTQLSEFIRDERLQLNYPALREHDVPQVLPVIDISDTLLDYLRKFGIGASTWPGDEIPEAVVEKKTMFPNAILKASSIVCIPIHQDVNELQLSYMKEVIYNWSQLRVSNR